jgi:two-component system, cell cycle sensor histidine kinase and response regulator CckA
MAPLRVLIVEDVEADAVLMLRQLDRGGYDVAHLRVDTADALRAALHEGQWDLLLSDFSLPTLDAMRVLEILNESGLDLPCIVISGTIEDEAAVSALKLGARDFISKDRLARLLPAISRELQEASDRRKKRSAEAALAEARRRMQFALEATGVGTWELELPAEQAIWSDVFERLHGRCVGTLGGTLDALLVTIHPEDRARIRSQIEVTTREAPDVQLLYRVVWPDQSVHWISGVGHMFFDQGGRAGRAAGTAMDITEQKRLEEQVRQAQRMESIGNLAGGVAHDFNNILTAILGHTTLLLEDCAHPIPPKHLQESLEEIKQASLRAAGLTNQLLAFSRKQIVQPRILNLNAVVDNLEPMLKRVIGEDVELSFSMADGLGTISADPGQVEQVVMNLIVNARDAMPRGGRITVETANIDLDDSYGRQHGAMTAGEYVMLTVSDTGVGIPPALLAKIFEPFFTTKPKGQGTGLGLATVYGIVKQHRGYVWVYSEEGKGTTFKVYLPRVDGTPVRMARPVEKETTKGYETILLVEDDDRVRNLAHAVLTRHGYSVLSASGVDEALQLAQTHTGTIHAAVTDVVMPGKSGHSLAEVLAGRYPEIRVLYMSGYTDDAIVHHGVLAPEVAFLQKPFTPASLARAVRAVLGPPTAVGHEH